MHVVDRITLFLEQINIAHMVENIAICLLKIFKISLFRLNKTPNKPMTLAVLRCPLLDIIEHCQFVYLSGSSLTKVIYRSKIDFLNGKQINAEVSN